MLSQILNFLKRDIWHIQAKTLSSSRSFFLRQLRIVLLAIRGFDEDKLQLRASALTFYSLLAIVPVVAMAFALAKGFGLETLLEERLLAEFSSQREVLIQVIGFANNLLDKTRGGIMAGIGMIILYWAVIKVLGHIEYSFNHIWNIKKSRSLWRKFSDYLTFMIISPILIILSSSFTVFIKTQITLIIEKIALLGFFSPLIYISFKLLPYFLIWILFTITYILMPNTRVNFRSGLVAGIVAGTFYQFVQLLYINFQFLISKYNAIYGSFAALPLFLIWLQISWLTVLIGAEISYAHQNSETYEFEPVSQQISFALKKMLSLQITHFLVKNFSKAENPSTTIQISSTLGIPLRLVQTIANDLVISKIISETESNEEGQTAYQPALDINMLTISYVMDALERVGTNELPIPLDRESDLISEDLRQFKDSIEGLSTNKLLKDI
jgi:membrane protein